MDQPHPQPGEHPLQPLVLGGGRCGFDLCAVLDKRTYDERLAALGNVFADQLLNPSPIRRAHAKMDVVTTALPGGMASSNVTSRSP